MRFVGCFLILSSLCGAESGIPEGVVQNILNHVHSNSWGACYYDVLPAVIRQHNYKTVVEIGVALGGHAEAILKHTDIDQYIGVDPYVSYSPHEGFQEDISKYSEASLQQNFDYLYEWVKNDRLAPFGRRCQLIRRTAAEAAASLPNDSIDCIFIDGNHSYEAVMSDLTAWFPKLKPGHLILGDDYWIPSVAAAVENFFAKENKSVFFFTSMTNYKIWAVYK